MSEGADYEGMSVVVRGQTYWAKIDWALNKDTGAGVVQGITIPEAGE